MAMDVLSDVPQSSNRTHQCNKAMSWKFVAARRLGVARLSDIPAKYAVWAWQQLRGAAARSKMSNDQI